jgi:hypothetical protein
MNKKSVYLVLLLVISFFSYCKKESTGSNKKTKEETSFTKEDASSLVFTQRQVDFISSKPIKKTSKSVALRDPSELGYIGIILSAGTKYDINIARNGPPRVLKGWKLLNVPGGMVFASGSLDLRESTSGNPTIYLGSVNNLPTGTYEIQLSYSETYAGGGGWWPTPNGVTYSSESYVQAYATGARIDVYRYWNSKDQDHFYTRIKTAYPGWGFESIAFQAISPASGTGIPMYRYWNGNYQDHLYTVNSSTYPGWVYEGIEFNVMPSAVSGTVPLYRYWNGASHDHFYTKTMATYSGYVYEGIEGYVY